MYGRNTILETPFLPDAYIERENKKEFVIRCPYCGLQHYHKKKAGLGITKRDCSSLENMSSFVRYRFEVSNDLFRNDKYNIIPKIQV